MADAPNLAKLVPGFDFLQQLAQGASSAMPGIGQWIAPTLDPKEIDKRIEELRTVQFWLEQNARLLGTTIQALEVQRMTLSTLQTMNVQMEDLRESLTIRAQPDASRSKAAPSEVAAAPASAPSGASAASGGAAPAPSAGASAPATAAAPAATAVDPMQWWGALTRQFTELAGSALRDGVGAATAAGTGAAGAARKAATSAASPAPAKKARRTKASPRSDLARKQAG